MKRTLTITTIAITAALLITTSAVAGFGRADLTDDEAQKVEAISKAYEARFGDLEKKIEAHDAKADKAFSNDGTTLGQLEEIRIERRALRNEYRDLREDKRVEVERAVGGTYFGKRGGMDRGDRGDREGRYEKRQRRGGDNFDRGDRGGRYAKRGDRDGRGNGNGNFNCSAAPDCDNAGYGRGGRGGCR